MSNFICEYCGMINIDCGKEGYKTPKEVVLEETLDKIKVIAENIIKNGSYENSYGKAQEMLILIEKVRNERLY